MFDSAVSDTLNRWQPQASHQLESACELAGNTLGNELLALCGSCLEATLLRKEWRPPRELSARERAYLAFADAFISSVSTITDQQVEALKAYASADEIYLFANALYILEMRKRVELVAGRVLL